MADVTATADVSQADADTGSQAEQESVSTQAAGTSDKETISPERYRKVVSEARGLRERLKQYEDKENATLTESEKLQKERDQLRAERDEAAKELRETRIAAQAAKLGAVYTDAIIALMPTDASTEKDIERALATLQRDRPRLFQTGSADGGAGGGNGQSNTLDMNALIRQKMGRT